jgi:hypothetical protein
MLFVDVNVLVYAHRPESPRHTDFLGWLEAARIGDEPLGISDQVLAGFVRIVTHPRVFKDPTPSPVAVEFASALRSAPAALPIVPGERVWSIFEELVVQTDARGNAIPDAFLASMAIDQGATLVTADRGFARFPRLRWRHPLD